MKFFFACLATLILSSPSKADQVAFFGDSITTGGAAHPFLMFELANFRDILSGNKVIGPDDDYRKAIAKLGYQFDRFEPPVRVLLSLREFSGPGGWFIENMWHSFGRQFLDAEEFSWSYLLARSLGFAGKDILMAAKNGEKMVHGYRQADRLLDHTNGILPEYMFFFFTGNDLCGVSLDMVTHEDDYANQLRRTLNYLIRNGKVGRKGSKIFLLDPIGVLQIAVSPSIQNKKIKFKGNELTCRQLQKGDIPVKPLQSPPTGSDGDLEGVAFELLAQPPRSYCPTLFAGHFGDTQAPIAISKRISGYRKKIAALVKEFKAKATGGVTVNHITSTSQLIFEGEDMANDCFHLGLGGHHKIAQTILEEMSTPPKSENL